MKIRYIEVKNFRGISEFRAVFSKNLLSIVGQNDVGKSSVLRALCVFFGKEKIGLEDFQKGNEEAQIEIQVHFEAVGLSQYKHNDTIKLLHIHKKTGDKVTTEKKVYSHLEPIDTEELDKYAVLKSVAKKFSMEVPNVKPSGEEIEILKRAVVERIENSPDEGWVDVNWDEISNSLPELIFIPATQDHENEQKMTNDTSLFGKLFRVGIRNWLKSDPESKSAMEVINSKVETINKQFLEVVEEKLKEQLPLAESLGQEIDPLDISKGFSFTMIVEDEHGIKTPLNQRGSGLQRAVLVAIIRTQNEINKNLEKMKQSIKQISIEDTSNGHSEQIEESLQSTLYIFEEPEAFLHLSAQKDLFYSLRDLAEQNSQVVITTHSTLFIDECDLDDVVLLVREYGRTISRQHVPHEEIKDQLGEQVRLSELLTGKVCCLVEGLSDKYAFERWAIRLGYDIKRMGIHFISMDGCHNMEYFANVSILHDFNVPFRIVLDNDSHGETNSFERIQFLKRKIPRLRQNCFAPLQKGELENYYCLDTVASVLNIPKEFIDVDQYDLDPKEELKRATQRAIDNGSKNARKYKETEHSRIISETMPIQRLDFEIVALIKELGSLVGEHKTALDEIHKGLGEVAGGLERDTHMKEQ